jgi:hypothetical protein
VTGAAAMEIGGVTTASEFHYMQNNMLRRMRLTPKETRLNIIDEVSFAGYHTALVGTRVISCRRLQNATNFNTGELPCVFLVLLT